MDDWQNWQLQNSRLSCSLPCSDLVFLTQILVLLYQNLSGESPHPRHSVSGEAHATTYISRKEDVSQIFLMNISVGLDHRDWFRIEHKIQDEPNTVLEICWCTLKRLVKLVVILSFFFLQRPWLRMNREWGKQGCEIET
jgi:hypothetical protein